MFKGLQKQENGPMGKELDGQMKKNNNNKHNDFFSLYFFTFSLLFLISLY